MCRRESSSCVPQPVQRSWVEVLGPVARQELYWAGAAGGGGHAHLTCKMLQGTAIRDLQCKLSCIKCNHNISQSEVFVEMRL